MAFVLEAPRRTPEHQYKGLHSTATLLCCIMTADLCIPCFSWLADTCISTRQMNLRSAQEYKLHP